MQRDKEIALIDEILGLRRAESAYLDQEVATSPVARYTDAARFGRERERLFHARPALISHSSELAGDGAFLVREHAGLKVLLTRDRGGDVHAFLNVCRHRGMELVADDAGCRHRFTCPYHAWTWDNRGRLIAVPHREQGFPGLDDDRYGLTRLAVEERHGWIWVQAREPMDLDSYLAGVGADFDWAGIADHVVHDVTEQEWGANWKIIAEGALEAYHFRVAHATTVGRIFHDNLSTYETMGPHIRSIIVKQSMDECASQPRDQWSLRAHSNILYTMISGASVIVLPDHIALIHAVPRAHDRTLVRTTTYRPKGADTPDELAYWDRNHQLTMDTLDEDFIIAEKIQQNLASGANRELTFGRYEGALDQYNRAIEQLLENDPEAMAAE